MKRIDLIPISKDYKAQILNYKAEFIKNNDSMDGTAGLAKATNFEDWFDLIVLNSKEETVIKGLVPSTTFLAIAKKNNHLIGMIDIRHQLNDYLLNFGGHIGYSVRKTERCQGYATEMLSLALIECKKLKLEKVLITCDQDNIASAKTIINNGGIMENEVIEDNRVTQRYWIKLK